MISRILDCILALTIVLGGLYVGWQVSAWIDRGLTVVGVLP